MKIKGLQKVTLIDYPGEIACTIFIFGCNFRCPFCHNPELINLADSTPQDIQESEILSFLEKKKNYLDGVCITGGEPLGSLDPEFIKKIKLLGYKIKIDTNGSFPEKLENLIKNKLVDYIAMDIKSSPEAYELVSGTKVNIKDIERSIKLIVSSGLNYEFRTTILRRLHSREDFLEMMRWLSGLCGGKKLKKFCLQAFQNQGKILSEEIAKEQNTPLKYLEELKSIAGEYFDIVEIRN